MWIVRKDVYKVRRIETNTSTKYLFGSFNRKFKYRSCAIFYIKFLAYWDVDKCDLFVKDEEIIISYTLSYE